jgi:PHS family inorganic phosphate transporter-like MFS transporter
MMSGPAGGKETRQRTALEEYEQSGEGRPPFILTYTEVKLLGIAGVSAMSIVSESA